MFSPKSWTSVLKLVCPLILWQAFKQKDDNWGLITKQPQENKLHQGSVECVQRLTELSLHHSVFSVRGENYPILHNTWLKLSVADMLISKSQDKKNTFTSRMKSKICFLLQCQQLFSFRKALLLKHKELHPVHPSLSVGFALRLINLTLIKTQIFSMRAIVEFENTPDVFHTSYFCFKVTDQGSVPFKCQVPQNGTITAETDYSISVWAINQKSNQFPFSAALFNFFCICTDSQCASCEVKYRLLSRWQWGWWGWGIVLL